jgi:alpha-muurolene/germacrene-A/gamma-muurolene synthase
MMTKDTDALSDAVMNALWFPSAYRPTKGQPDGEIDAAKLARE